MTLLQGKPDQIEKENEKSGTKLDHERSLITSIVKEELTTLKGVGPRTKEILQNAGIFSIAQLAQMTDTNLIQVGVGQATAKKIITGAKEHIHKKNLDAYVQVENPLNNNNEESEPLIVDDDPFFDSDIDELEDDGITVLNSDVIDYKQKNLYNDKTDTGFAEKSNYSHLTDSSSLKRDIKEKDEIRSKLIPVETKDAEFLPQLSIKGSSPLQEEFTYQNNYYSILEKLNNKIKPSDFYVIKKNQKLRLKFVGIDAIAIKLIRIKEFLDVICIVPILLSKLKGNFTVSEGFIDYTSINENENLFQTKKQAQSYITSLKRAEQTISKDLANNGELLYYIAKFFDINISSEKTITNKMLYLHSGPVQYEVLIEPIIVCQNSVGFTEKLIPFAYIREVNIHVVPLSQVSDLLSYLDQKYFFIETYSEKQNAIILNNKADTTFMKEIRVVSVPFIIYGFIFLLIFLFQRFSLLSLLINIGCGVVGLYIVVIGYIYLKLTHQKKEIKQQFAVPYYKRDLGLNDERLYLIRQQFTPKLMEQFGYEILGKGSDSALMEKVEQENVENYLTDKAMKRQLEQSKLFEEETTPYSDSPRPNISPEAIDKYSSFLED
ncbi:MAG: helix-hairpin-helix domain-containing protein [Candidatus Thorarchaeota archaeon]